MNYIAYRTDDGKNAGKIRFYCKALEVSRQAFYDYLKRKKKPWKYQPLADAMLKIHAADEENADYGRIRMFQALQYQKEIGELGEVTIPSEGTVRKIMEQIHLIYKPKRKPNGITKADREARKSDHSDRGSQYTSAAYRAVIQKYGIVQSMNRAGGRCHDHARCESIWARMKEELFYHRGRKTEHYKMEELKFMVWRYFMGYWSNRRICSSIGGLPPAVKRQRFYAAVAVARFAS